MVLIVDLDAAYLVISKAKSRIARYYYLSNHLSKTNQLKLNSIILVECKALRNVVSSLAKAETGGVFHNTQKSIPIHYMLESLNYA